MRFMTIYSTSQPESDAPPTDKEIADMGALIDEMFKAGVLLATDGLLPSALGARVRISGSEFEVTDGPFTETKELIAGYAIIDVPSLAIALEWSKRFLTVAGNGQSEVRQMHDQRPLA